MDNLPALLSADELTTIKELVSLFLASKLFKDTEGLAAGVTKVIAGRELGVSPFVAMRDLSVIQGKITMAAAQVGARIKGSGTYDYEVVRLDDKGCELRFLQKSRMTGKWAVCGNSTFTEKDAMAAGLMGRGDMYRKYPRNMYFSRALTNGARWYCPEVFNGAIYTPDELSRGEPEPIDLGAATVEPEIVTGPEISQVDISDLQLDEVLPEPLPNPWLHSIENSESVMRGKHLFEIPTAWFNKALKPANATKLSAADRANVLAAMNNPELRGSATEALQQEIKGQFLTEPDAGEDDIPAEYLGEG